MNVVSNYSENPAVLLSRRSFLGAAAAASATAALPLKAESGSRVMENEWTSHFPSPPQVYERLEQDLMFERVLPDTDTFGHTEMVTSPTDDYVPNLMMRALDLNGHYWALWQHADNLVAYREQFKRGFQMLDRHLGYRVRPAYIWVGEKKPLDLIIAIRNDGAAPPPGILQVHVSDAEGKLRIGGGLDPGTPGPFQMRQCRIVLPVDIDWRTLRLSAEIEIKGVRHPVRWACREKLNPDGSLSLRRTNGIRS